MLHEQEIIYNDSKVINLYVLILSQGVTWL